MTDKEEIKFAIRYLKKGLKSKRTPPLYEELMNELGFEKKVNNYSGVAVDFFKENYPEYVTEKGECLSPYWDLFSAGVICATFELNNEIAGLKAYNEKLLDGDIEKHNKIVELQRENEELKKQQFSLRNERNTFLVQNEQYEKDLINSNENLTKAKEIIKRLLKATYGEGWNYSLQVKVEAEKFLKEEYK